MANVPTLSDIYSEGFRRIQAHPLVQRVSPALREIGANLDVMLGGPMGVVNILDDAARSERLLPKIYNNLRKAFRGDEDAASSAFANIAMEDAARVPDEVASVGDDEIVDYLTKRAVVGEKRDQINEALRSVRTTDVTQRVGEEGGELISAIENIAAPEALAPAAPQTISLADAAEQFLSKFREHAIGSRNIGRRRALLGKPSSIEEVKIQGRKISDVARERGVDPKTIRDQIEASQAMLEGAITGQVKGGPTNIRRVLKRVHSLADIEQAINKLPEPLRPAAKAYYVTGHTDMRKVPGKPSREKLEDLGKFILDQLRPGLIE